MTITQNRETRVAGWDSKVRKRVRLEVGSIRALADELSVSHDDILTFPGSDMKVWSRIINHFADGTNGVEDYLNTR